MKQEKINRFLHICFVVVDVWLLILLIISFASQGKRYLTKQHHVYEASELSQPKMVKKKKTTYTCYEKKRIENDKKEYILLEIDGTACYWTPEEIENYVSDKSITTSIATLTFSIKRSGLDKVLYGDEQVTYVKYGCMGSDDFSEEEIAYYKTLAARKFTHSVYSLWHFPESEYYQDFVINENQF